MIAAAIIVLLLLFAIEIGLFRRSEKQPVADPDRDPQAVANALKSVGNENELVEIVQRYGFIRHFNFEQNYTLLDMRYRMPVELRQITFPSAVWQSQDKDLIEDRVRHMRKAINERNRKWRKAKLLGKTDEVTKQFRAETSPSVGELQDLSKLVDMPSKGPGRSAKIVRVKRSIH